MVLDMTIRFWGMHQASTIVFYKYFFGQQATKMDLLWTLFSIMAYFC